MFGLDQQTWEELKGIYTATEIDQQPELWLEALNIVESQREEISKFINANLKKDKVRIIFTGAGTSAYVGDIVSAQLNKNNEHIFEAIPTTDIVANPEMYFRKSIPTILVSFARSGNSPESVAAYELANQLVEDIDHIFITCNKEGKLAKIADNKDNILLLLMPEKSNDKGFAMTSSFSCMTLSALLVFNMDDFENKKNQALEMIKLGRDLLDNQYMKLDPVIKDEFERVVYLGSGSFYGLSKEGALKLLELTRGQITSLSESVLGFRHGPKSILNDKTLVFIFISSDEYARRYELDLLNEIYHNTGGHKIIPISLKYEEDLKKLSHDYLYVNQEGSSIVDDGFMALLYGLYAQILALKTSVKTKINPDDPSPSGLVNRVVQGVCIYEYRKAIDKEQLEIK